MFPISSKMEVDEIEAGLLEKFSSLQTVDQPGERWFNVKDTLKQKFRLCDLCGRQSETWVSMQDSSNILLMLRHSITCRYTSVKTFLICQCTPCRAFSDMLIVWFTSVETFRQGLLRLALDSQPGTAVFLLKLKDRVQTTLNNVDINVLKVTISVNFIEWK